MKRSAFVILTGLLLAVSLLSACDAYRDYTVEIESNTSWSGSFAGESMSGSGNRTIDIGDDGYLCCVVQKNSVGGRLRMRIIWTEDNGAQSSWAWRETTEAYGHLRSCFSSN